MIYLIAAIAGTIIVPLVTGDPGYIVAGVVLILSALQVKVDKGFFYVDRDRTTSLDYSFRPDAEGFIKSKTNMGKN